MRACPLGLCGMLPRGHAPRSRPQQELSARGDVGISLKGAAFSHRTRGARGAVLISSPHTKRAPESRTEGTSPRTPKVPLICAPSAARHHPLHRRSPPTSTTRALEGNEQNPCGATGVTSQRGGSFRSVSGGAQCTLALVVVQGAEPGAAVLILRV